MTSARAPAKLILFGEHAVVHGAPAIAVPVRACGTEVEIDFDGGTDVVVTDERAIDTALARDMAAAALARAERPGGARVRVRSTIPVGSGLGSSAALAVALVRAAARGPLSAEEAAARALDLERLAHGTPSGIDSTAIAWDRPIAFTRGAPPEPLAIGAPLRLAVGVLPREGTTASLVAGVRELAARDPARFRDLTDGIADVAGRARAALTAGNARALGPLMAENQRALAALGVSTSALERACAAATAAGALGAKLSGAGGGGAVIALLDAPGRAGDPALAVLAALRAVGAADAFVTEVT